MFNACIGGIGNATLFIPNLARAETLFARDTDRFGCQTISRAWNGSWTRRQLPLFSPEVITLKFKIATLSLLACALFADTLGFVEQKFSHLNFERGKWQRSTTQAPCYTYLAKENGATVEVLRYGTSNLVTFKAAKGLSITVCGSTAAFDEGFETGMRISEMARQH
jgi:hypothetical protein